MKYLSPTGILRHSVGSPITVAVAFLVFAAIPALMYTTYTVNYHNQNNRMDEDVSQIAQDINKKVAELNTVMSSLIGLHYASSDIAENEISLYAKELRAQTDFITGIGRYDYILDSDRISFEERMSEKGLFNFKITDLNQNGLSKPRITQDSYYPISMLEPLEPENARLLGADFSVVASLSKQLDSITAWNAPVLTTVPELGSTGGDMLIFAPIYRGNAAPTAPAARMAQSAGGFWISIDMDALVAGVNPNITRFDVIARITDSNLSTMVFGQLGVDPETSYLSSIYLRKSTEKVWRYGNSSLTFNLQHDLGFTKSTLFYFFAALIIILAVTSLFTVYILSRRSALHNQLIAQEALFQERERAEKTLNTVQDAIIAIDSAMMVVHINPAAATQFNTTVSDPLGHSLDNFVQFRLINIAYSAFNIEQALKDVDANSRLEFDVTPLKNKDSEFVLRLTITSSVNTENTVTGHVLVLRDISQERRLSKKLAYQANHDALTGCTNRHYFESILTALVDDLPGSDTQHALCYMDLDQFKVINDTCGHAAGDQLLIDLTTNLNLIVSENDILSRLGGDEFGLIMKDVDEEEVAQRTQNIYDFFQNYVFHYDSKSFAVRASIGVVHIDDSCDNLKDVLASADIACYAAKDAGRNTVFVYSNTDDAIAERSKELSWLPRLRQAIENDEFRLLVQAVASVEELCNKGDNPIEHYEFLIRLQNPDGSLSTPWQFIQAAERYDLMTEIDRWVIRNAFRMVADLKGGVCTDCSFSINLSGQSAADRTLKDFIQEQLEYYAVDPSKIWFEVTETAAISNFSVAVDLINSIRSLGSLVALDDFGSGLSSFGYLKNLPVDILKIDGQFVKEIAKNPIDREMVRAIHQVGQSMGIKTVAEFVEDEDIVQVLSEIGVQYAQGYHIGKPMWMEEAIELQKGEFKRAA
ncbi:EAL domain-containing protein [Granulosicoccus sp.]|nr:EAL domain-containing protein [Granulosicoccus sp.]MDB4222703.1 EAL domain-containing protein [Granulosicoccus sp.]